MTFFYNNAQADGDLGNVLNWWSNSGFTIPGVVPNQSIGSVVAVVTADASTNTGGIFTGCQPSAMDITGGTFSATVVSAGAITISAGVIIDGASLQVTNAGQPITLNGSSVVQNSVITMGFSEFVVSNGDSLTQIGVNTTIVNGGLKFGGAYIDAIPSIGSGSSVSGPQNLTGSITFSGADNTVTPSLDGSFGTWNFVGKNNSGAITCHVANFTAGGQNSGGSVTADSAVNFDATSSNSGGTVVGAAFFGGGSANASGTVTGNATFNGVTNSVGFSGTVSGTIALGSTFALEASGGPFVSDTTGWTIDSSATFTLTSTASNTGTLPRLVIAGTGTNLGGTVTGKLTVPGTQSGSEITSNLTQSNLGTFGSLAISGISGGSSDILGTGLL